MNTPYGHAMLPNDSHPGRGCSCRECLIAYPDEDFGVADYDGAPYCQYGHATKASCDCGDIAENE